MDRLLQLLILAAADSGDPSEWRKTAWMKQWTLIYGMEFSFFSLTVFLGECIDLGLMFFFFFKCAVVFMDSIFLT